MKAKRCNAVLISGVYGSGKSSVAIELAYRLEQRGYRFALLDLDFLGWANIGSDHDAGFPVLLRNVAAVMSNYREAGITMFVLAHFVRDAGQLDALREVVGEPVSVVRLEVPLAEIERRLSGDVTTGRADDLKVAVESVASGAGMGIEDVVISNDRAISDVAQDVMRFLEWDLQATT
jgi:hypothetical protein